MSTRPNPLFFFFSELVIELGGDHHLKDCSRQGRMRPRRDYRKESANNFTFLAMMSLRPIWIRAINFTTLACSDTPPDDFSLLILLQKVLAQGQKLSVHLLLFHGNGMVFG